MGEEAAIYEKLEPGHIRLIRVVACTEDLIECEMKQFPLDTERPWYALSYVWGTEPAGHKVLLNGQQTRARPNLAAALRALSKAPANDPALPKDLWIWIDALCINQGDDKEKARQIPLMGELYSRARVVLVWLGHRHDPLVVDMLVWIDAKMQLSGSEDEDQNFWQAKVDGMGSRLDTMQITEPAREALYSLHQHLIAAGSFQNEASNLWSTGEEVEAWSATHHLQPDLTPPEHTLWKGFDDLIQGQWYRRAWTYQEICMAHHAKVLFPHDLARYLLVEQFAIISWNIRFNKDSFNESEPIVFQENIWSLDCLPGHMEGHDQYLVHHMILSRNRHATEPRDYSYALIGMRGEQPQINMNIDYELPLHVVFVDLMHATVLEYAAGLPNIWEIFSKSMTEQQELPSWCPNFENRQIDIGFLGSSLEITSDAARSRFIPYAQVSFAEQPPILVFSAWRLDRVLFKSDNAACMSNRSSGDKSTTCSDEHADKISRLFAQLRNWLHVFLDDSFPWAVTELNIAKLLRVLPLTKPSSIRLADMSLDTQRVVAGLILKYCNLSDESSDADLFSQRTQQTDFPTDGLRALCHLLEETVKTLHKTNVLQTTSGKFGLSALPVYKGDLILYLPGGTQLHVLSADGGHYRTTARIEGYMEDDLLTIIRNPADDIETFHLT